MLITLEQMAGIYEMEAEGYSVEAISLKYGMSTTTIRQYKFGCDIFGFDYFNDPEIHTLANQAYAIKNKAQLEPSNTKKLDQSEKDAIATVRELFHLQTEVTSGMYAKKQYEYTKAVVAELKYIVNLMKSGGTWTLEDQDRAAELINSGEYL